MKQTILLMAMACALVLTNGENARAASTIETVKNRGYIECGVTDRVPGFSSQKSDGEWAGFYIDFCRAIGAAVIGDAKAIGIDDYWLDALEGREIDVLHAGSTWTFVRDTTRDIEFPGIYFYDGQGFMAHAKLGAKSLKEAMALEGVRVCAIGPTSTARTNLADFIAKNKLPWTLVPIKTMDGMWRAFFGSRCDMAIHDRSALAAVHAGRLEDSDDFIVFAEVISKEPLAPAVRADDVQWRDLVAWVSLVMIAAEELGVSKDNVDYMKAASESSEVRRLLGEEPGLGQGFGLDDEWGYRIIKQVGNYGDVFERNLGIKTPFKMARGLNNLWRDGGLLYAPPIR
ncbi:amino acid ABC transporter substrate-binding protein [Magnetovibrio sp.]|uniref:amino acid ABC transporter substrate-binding protein n=1 Tax=Magnetovibrio sp. TaxID=2024836 RepID=UPI002F9217E9